MLWHNFVEEHEQKRKMDADMLWVLLEVVEEYAAYTLQQINVELSADYQNQNLIYLDEAGFNLLLVKIHMWPGTYWTRAVWQLWTMPQHTHNRDGIP